MSIDFYAVLEITSRQPSNNPINGKSLFDFAGLLTGAAVAAGGFGALAVTAEQGAWAFHVDTPA